MQNRNIYNIYTYIEITPNYTHFELIFEPRPSAALSFTHTRALSLSNIQLRVWRFEMPFHHLFILSLLPFAFLCLHRIHPLRNFMDNMDNCDKVNQSNCCINLYLSPHRVHYGQSSSISPTHIHSDTMMGSLHPRETRDFYDIFMHTYIHHTYTRI